MSLSWLEHEAKFKETQGTGNLGTLATKHQFLVSSIKTRCLVEEGGEINTSSLM